MPSVLSERDFLEKPREKTGLLLRNLATSKVHRNKRRNPSPSLLKNNKKNPSSP